MQAIILAAGMGKRLGSLTENNTKCMVKVNGTSLIERMLAQLEKTPIERIVIVVGYKSENLKSFIGGLNYSKPIVFVENKVFDKTNNIYSLALAKNFLVQDDSILLESDLIFEDEILDLLIDSPLPNVALVSKYQSWMDGTMVCIDKENKITNFISKSSFKFEDTESYYKTVNIYKFSKDFCEKFYVPFLEAYMTAFGNNEYYEQVLRAITMLDKTNLTALPIGGKKWYEIDDVQDLDIAEAIFADADIKLQKYTKRYGGYWRFPSIVDFCYLVNPYFPSQKMLDEIKSNFDTLISEYPSGMSVNSLLIAKYFGIKKEYACVGNGAAELIKFLCEKLKGKIGVILPSFEEYLNRIGNRAEIFNVKTPSFSFRVDDLIQYFDDKQISTLVVVNPDNPSGCFLSEKDIKKLLTWSKQKSINLLIDESFVDFANENFTLLNNSILQEFKNLIVVKSISKSYGVPGLRLGVIASANEDIINAAKKDVAIWNINSFAEFYLQIYGKYEREYKTACEKFKIERERFFKELSKIKDLRVLPSQANYFLCEVLNNNSSTELTNKLLEQNILIKDCATKKGFNGENYIRIAIRNKVDNDNFILALKNILK